MFVKMNDEENTSFDDLVFKIRGMLPTLYPQWTDHNSSDVGMTFNELFAFIAEIFIYQFSHISKKNFYEFLKLINSDNVDFDSGLANILLTRIIQSDRKERRGIITKDYERLALSVSGVKKAFCVIGDENKIISNNGNIIYMAVIPEHDSYDEFSIIAPEELIDKVVKEISPVCMLGVTLKVIPVKPVVIPIKMKVHLFKDAILDSSGMQKVNDEIIKKLLIAFDPLTTWKINGCILFSHLYAVIDQIAGVDYLDQNEINFDIDSKHEMSLHQEIIGFKPITFDEIPLLSKDHIVIEFIR